MNDKVDKVVGKRTKFEMLCCLLLWSDSMQMFSEYCVSCNLGSTNANCAKMQECTVFFSIAERASPWTKKKKEENSMSLQNLAVKEWEKKFRNREPKKAGSSAQIEKCRKDGKKNYRRSIAEECPIRNRLYKQKRCWLRWTGSKDFTGTFLSSRQAIFGPFFRVAFSIDRLKWITV